MAIRNKHLVSYQGGIEPLPEFNLSWPLYGAGLENLGKQGSPVALPLPEIADDQLLVRVDAVGLCFSDIKLITQGATHPRIYGRNLADDPAIPGHEASLTVVKVGSRWQDHYRVGERYLIQADVFYQGKSLAFGYVLPGALQQYTVIGPEILAGDEGSYLLPVKEDDGYAEVALSEPWACVVASYRIGQRQNIKAGGTTWLIVSDEAGLYSLDGAFAAEGLPKRVVISGVEGKSRAQLLETLDGIAVLEDHNKGGSELAEIYAEGLGFDDIVFLGTPRPEQLEDAAKVLAVGGVLAVLAETPLSREVSIDIGRIHYDSHLYVGARTRNVAEAYKENRSVKLKPQGRAWLIGAGGPMGQMHTQLAAEDPQGPGLIVVTDINDDRLRELEDRFSEAAAARGAQLVALNPQGMDGEEWKQRLLEVTQGELFDDIVVLAPAPSLVEDAAAWLESAGILNIFAGVPRGTPIKMDLSQVYLAGQRWVGSSGSSLGDLRYTLEQIQKRSLDSNRSVAAISGLNAAGVGLKAVQDGGFPGKIVVYPQFPTLPLIPLSELSKRLPEVGEKLSPEGFWTKAAEDQLFSSELAKK